jgi:hypothetical protein
LERPACNLYHRHRFIDIEDTRDGIDEVAQGLNLRYTAARRQILARLSARYVSKLRANV